ncbi:cysteine--tRNA ligase [Marinagarivorans cellulosilyticus]|uniref:Cysteine--tRNA ligase n=1 Tax=Marinagarivorans cellulosilyticus TaxID=2721545 RepID=A0AAN1WJ38_9GAMM|nr:cysteine--tRNA ligase [Marinagarivorans cellulosilyticus]BCD98512.1 cysteinyl-tRNA synthetase [Marinagarivorans cellulosilyticus]
MSLVVYNTQKRIKEPFTPVDPSDVRMYVCGPTVYNFVHIGNARPVVVFDTLFRVLQSLYPKVTYARNITDIDDKIMKTANDVGETIESLAGRFAREFEADMAALNNLQPSIVPYATHHVTDMVAMVSNLVEKGHAYEAQGHVLFDVKSMPNYGKLSGQSIDAMLDGARVEVADYKKYAGDFVLWKPSAEDEPGWPSPWGRGRPGWHLECSAMIEKHLGNTIDVHGGGRDLIFPHHENELAQSECAHGGEQYVKYWMHNGYVNIDGEKMSKSLGNFKTVRDLLGSYKGEVIRFALLSAQYRSELDFSVDLLDQSAASLDGIYGALRKVDSVEEAATVLADSAAYKALLDDLNTPQAISELHQLTKRINKAQESELPALKSELLAVANLMGILQQDPEEWFKSTVKSGMDAAKIDALIEERLAARAAKNWVRSDEIRDMLLAQGVVLEDSKEGTTWRFE